MPQSRRPSTDQTTPTRERIIGAARDLFAEQGYSATSVSQIARRADVLPGSMYWAFESKEQMFAAALEDAAKDWRAGIGSDEGVPPLRPGDIRRALAPYADAFTTTPDFIRLLIVVATERSAGTPENLAAAAAVRQGWRQVSEAALRKTFAGRDPAVVAPIAARLARLLLSLLDGAHLGLLLEPGPDRARQLLMEAAEVFERELVAALEGLGEPVTAGG